MADGVTAVLLAKQVDKEIVYGAASLLDYQGFQSLGVVAHYMPDPSSFGADYNAYGFSLMDPDSCRILAHQPMVSLAAQTNDWAGTYELGVPTRPLTSALIIVYPVTSQGPGTIIPVLAGTLRVT